MDFRYQAEGIEVIVGRSGIERWGIRKMGR